MWQASIKTHFFKPVLKGHTQKLTEWSGAILSLYLKSTLFVTVTKAKQHDDLKSKHTAKTLLQLMGRYSGTGCGLRKWKSLPLKMKINILRRKNVNKILIQAIMQFSVYLLYSRGISQRYILALQCEKKHPLLQGMHCCHKENRRPCKLTTEHKDVWSRHILTQVAAKCIR